MNYDIIIDGTIGYPYSAELIASKLKGKSGKPVTVRVDSYGGSVRDAIDIRRQFIDHGNVTCVVTGMTASAATLICTGARQTLVDPCALMLIHRCSKLVGFVGYTNKSDLDALAESLGQTADDLATIDDAMAMAYAKKTKKTCAEMLELMDAADWLSADKCVEIGLADALLDEDVAPTNLAARAMAEMAAAGLTLPAERLAFAAYHVPDEEDKPKTATPLSTLVGALLKADEEVADEEETTADTVEPEDGDDDSEADETSEEEAADEAAEEPADRQEQPADTAMPEDGDEDSEADETAEEEAADEADEETAAEQEQPAEGVDELLTALGVDQLMAMPEGLLRLTVAQAVTLNDEMAELKKRIKELEKTDGATTADIESAEQDDDFAARVDRMYRRLA